MNRHDAWVIARLLSDKPVNGELVGTSEAFQSLAERLAVKPVEARGDVWDGFLMGKADRNDILKAVADADPSRPQPEECENVAPAPARPRAKLICVADIETRPVEWLWSGRVPLGVLSLWSGDPKLGKSLATIAVAAAVSRGAPLPGENHSVGPADVIMMSAEDDPARTIRPRLNAAGANHYRVHLLTSIWSPGSDGEQDAERWPTLLACDLATIEAAAAGLDNCKLIVVDPVSAYLEGVDDHRNVELRSILSRLKTTAERLNVAVLLVTHLSKSAATNGKHRVIGSIAYTGAARANYMFVRDRTDPTGRRVLMLDNGCNLAPPQPGLAYVVEDRGQGPSIEWLDEPVAITVEQALAAENDTRNAAHVAEHYECDRWLRETLAGGRMLVAEIRKAGSDESHSWDAIKRSKRRICAVTEREGFGPGSKCYWRLSDEPNGNTVKTAEHA